MFLIVKMPCHANPLKVMYRNQFMCLLSSSHFSFVKLEFHCDDSILPTTFCLPWLKSFPMSVTLAPCPTAPFHLCPVLRIMSYSCHRSLQHLVGNIPSTCNVQTAPGSHLCPSGLSQAWPSRRSNAISSLMD